MYNIQYNIPSIVYNTHQYHITNIIFIHIYIYITHTHIHIHTCTYIHAYIYIYIYYIIGKAPIIGRALYAVYLKKPLYIYIYIYIYI